MSVPAIHRNVIEYFENNVSKPHAETKRDINQIIRDTLLLLLEAVIEQILDLIRGREPNNHHQETSIVEPSICESIIEPLEEKLHSHCLSDDNSSYLNLDSNFDYVSTEEEKVEINQISIEEQSCGHIVVEDQVCEDDKEVRNEHIYIFPYQMNDYDHLS